MFDTKGYSAFEAETQFLNILSNEFYKDRLLTLIKITLSLIMIPRRRGGKICQIFDEWSKPEGGRQPRAHHVHCRRSISKIFWLLTVSKTGSFMKVNLATWDHFPDLCTSTPTNGKYGLFS